MTGPDPAVAATRVAVRPWCAQASAPVLVACSGGADSLALAAAVAFEAHRVNLAVGAVVVDHQLQADSDLVASRAAQQCRSLGLGSVEVVEVDVLSAGLGAEAAARQARMEALTHVAHRCGAETVLLGHTLNDQAEQVLLGLSRGSGSRSLAGMPARRGIFARPFLGITRATTEAACHAQGLAYWSDPHNDDPRFARVRVRRLLDQAEDDLGPGLAQALARSADLLRQDADTLDELAQRTRQWLGAGPWSVEQLSTVLVAVRARVWRLLAIEAGCSPGQLTSVHIRELDRLVEDWHGQGPVSLPGGVRGSRQDDEVHLSGGSPLE